MTAIQQESLLNTFSKLIDDRSATNQQSNILKSTWIETPLAPMIAIADEKSLYLLEFLSRKGLEKEVERLQRCGFAITPGETSITQSIAIELKAYFEGKLTQFNTPYHIFGSPFQQDVWRALTEIPYGETRSYREQAISLDKPNAFRAVANANGANQLAIMIPCHRVIASNGTLGGYGGGLSMKQWLLEHEKQYK